MLLPTSDGGKVDMRFTTGDLHEPLGESDAFSDLKCYAPKTLTGFPVLVRCLAAENEGCFRFLASVPFAVCKICRWKTKTRQVM